MEHPGEIWQEVDYNGEKIGGIEPRDHDQDDVKLYYATSVMLYRYVDGEVEFLFQQRSPKLVPWANPGKWDVSAGGHVNVDETMIEGMVREAREEIGAKILPEKLEFAASYTRWKTLLGLYFYDWTGLEDDFHFDDEEVAAVEWVKYADVEKFAEKLKRTLKEDEIFRICLRDWREKVLAKYENHKS